METRTLPMKNPAKEPRLVGLNPLFWGDVSAELLNNFKIYRTDIRAAFVIEQH